MMSVEAFYYLRRANPRKVCTIPTPTPAHVCCHNIYLESKDKIRIPYTNFHLDYILKKSEIVLGFVAVV